MANKRKTLKKGQKGGCGIFGCGRPKRNTLPKLENISDPEIAQSRLSEYSNTQIKDFLENRRIRREFPTVTNVIREEAIKRKIIKLVPQQPVTFTPPPRIVLPTYPEYTSYVPTPTYMPPPTYRYPVETPIPPPTVSQANLAKRRAVASGWLNEMKAAQERGASNTELYEIVSQGLKAATGNPSSNIARLLRQGGTRKSKRIH
uniref:Uncharacterized protein n=1 Tax=viral metagenome TaxID=1070528 RepID=A0A6C0AQF3_9ZZZZ